MATCFFTRECIRIQPLSIRWFPNPLDTFDVAFAAAPSLTDLNGDGVYDVFVGNRDGEIEYFVNVGDISNPQFTTTTNNPLEGASVGALSSPTLADIDADGDLDAFIGEAGGTINFYDNNAGVFERKFGTDSPTEGYTFSPESAPAFVDIDGDTDLDLFVGAGTTIRFFRNDPAAFVEVTGAGNPFNQSFSRPKPVFVDIDSNGTIDAFVADQTGKIRFFDNTGSLSVPAFLERTGTDNPADTVSRNNAPAMTFADLDEDGDLDLVVGQISPVTPQGAKRREALPTNDPLVAYFNTGSPTSPAFVPLPSTFDTLSFGYTTTPILIDVDQDGDLDLLVGSNSGKYSDGSIDFFENTGTTASPKWVEQFGPDNPFSDFSFLKYTVPAFADLDGDGDPDLLVAHSDQFNNRLDYFENTSTVITSVGPGAQSVARVFKLHQNYPNPFNPSTTITYDLPAKARVELRIYNLLGQEVKTLVRSQEKNQGQHSILWDGRDRFGKTVASGVYIYRLQAGKHVQTRKFMFLK